MFFRSQTAAPAMPSNGRREAAHHACWLIAVQVLIAIAAGFAAGAAHAQIGVSSAGQATYTYPLSVPPGIGGMAPNLSLSYVDGGINGPLGMGWSLQGISVITRCGATRATDGTARAVDFTSADKLCLDGQRLIQTNAAGSTDSIAQQDDALGSTSIVREFRTEKDSFARVRTYGQISSTPADGPAYIKVWTKSGQLYEYGLNPADNSANAVITAQGRSAVMVWAVRRVSDVVGNYIDFSYTQREVAWGSGTAAAGATGKEWNVSEIRYTGNGSNSPSNKVSFIYEDRSADASPNFDRSEAYQISNKNVSIQLLKSIRTYVNTAASPVAVRSYQLGYIRGTYTGRSRLTSVKECVGDDSKCLPPTTFDYSNGGLPDFKPNSNFATVGDMGTLKMIEAATGNYGVVTGDFNGDGRTDILRWSNMPSENKLYFSAGDGNFSAATKFNLGTQSLFKTDGCYYATVADFNGDGLSDLLRVAKTGCSPSTSILFLSNGDGSFSSVELPSAIDLQQQKATYKSTTTSCVPKLRSGVSSATDNAAARSGITTSASTCYQYSGTLGKRYYILDVNGDGFLDIVTTISPVYSWDGADGPLPSLNSFCNVCSRVYIGDGAGGFIEKSDTSIRGKSLYNDPPGTVASGNPYWKMPGQADIDGDGLQDILSYKTGNWRSLGDGNFASFVPTDTSQICALPIDFNGDGRADCLRPDSVLTNQSLYLSLGSGSSGALAQFNLTNNGDNLYAIDGNSRQTVGVVTEDFDGDGKQDILRWGPSPSDNGIYLSKGDGSFRTRAAAGLGSLTRPLQSADGKSAFALGDFLGNGTLQILHMKDTPTAAGDPLDKKNQLYQRASGGSPADALSGLFASNGLRSEITAREPLPNSQRYITDRGTGNKAVAPKVDLLPPLYVVTRTNQYTGVSGASSLLTDYMYLGLKLERGGRGLLGFREVRQRGISKDGTTYITTATEYLQSYPYIGAAGVARTYLGDLNLSGLLLSRVTNSYCDKTSTLTPSAISSFGMAPVPCATTAKVQRPYLYQTSEEGWDLDGSSALPTVVTTSKYNDTGDATEISVQTKDLSQSVARTSTTTNVYDTNSANTAADKWVLGRLLQATVANKVSSTLANTSSGASPHATERVGSGPLPPPAQLPPEVLSAILQLLLDD